MQVHINGEVRSFPAGTTLASVVEVLGIAGKRIAVERNGEIVPKSRHAQTIIVDGDHLEIVGAVGGG
ncbi:MAG: sulfur carrier protein ThiS [Casimicrobiaceae bacterium]